MKYLEAKDDREAIHLACEMRPSVSAAERLMARYFLHLRAGTEEVPDELGEEFVTPEALQAQMLASAST